jgi:hypothetical protein
MKVFAKKGHPSMRDPFNGIFVPLVRESLKVKMVRQLMEKMRTKRDQNGLRIKGVIFTVWPVTAYLIKLVSILRIPSS